VFVKELPSTVTLTYGFDLDWWPWPRYE